MLQDDTNHPRLGMPCHVRQRLLQDAIHGRLHEWGKPARDAAFHSKVDDNSHRFGKVTHVPPHGRHEPLVVQDGGMQPARQPTDIIHRVGGNFPQTLRDHAGFRQLRDVRDATQADQ